MVEGLDEAREVVEPLRVEGQARVLIPVVINYEERDELGRIGCKIENERGLAPGESKGSLSRISAIVLLDICPQPAGKRTVDVTVKLLERELGRIGRRRIGGKLPGALEQEWLAVALPMG